jgi:hypothetical protein
MNLPASFRFRSCHGFTMLEVLFAGMILALASFTVLGLLRLSDEMTYRAKADAKVSQIFKARGGFLVSTPFEDLRRRVAPFTPVDPSAHIYQFQLGQFTADMVENPARRGNDTEGFPFLEPTDPFSEGDFDTPKYLLYGKPLPGTSSFRSIFPFREFVELDFNGPPSTATECIVRYELSWINDFRRSTIMPDAGGQIDPQKLGRLQFTFLKHDPSSY